MQTERRVERTPREQTPALVGRAPPRRRRIARRVLWAVAGAGGAVAVLVAVLLILRALSVYYVVPFLDLLRITIVPLTVGGAVPLLNWLQKRRELAVESRRTQDAALLAYLDKMSELLIDKNLHDKSNEYDQTRVAARARTLAVLGQLDGERKRTVLLFLREARLINREKFVNHQTNIIYHPRYVGLDGADLAGANLRRARLISTDRAEPISLKGAVLAGADLEGTDLEKADLGGADLRNANMSKANLRSAVLGGAALLGADLSWADLSHADLSGASGITGDELEQQARSLAGATMPDGTEHA